MSIGYTSIGGYYETAGIMRHLIITTFACTVALTTTPLHLLLDCLQLICCLACGFAHMQGGKNERDRRLMETTKSPCSG